MYITIVLLLLYIFAGCERVNIYDLSSGKSRTAYALIQEGAKYTLAIVNTQFVKLYKTNLPSIGTPGIAVNDKRILVYDKLNTYPCYTNTDNLNEWIVYNTDTNNTNIIGYNNSFIRIVPTYDVQYINDSLSAWQLIGTVTSDYSDIFQGYDGDVYVLAYQSIAGQESFYKVNEQNIELVLSNGEIISPPCLSLYKTKNYFYLIL